MSSFRVKTVMFDLDGTLINSAPEIAFAANQTLAALNLSTLSESQITDYIGEGAHVLIQRCLTASLQQTPEEDVLERAIALFFTCYEKIVGDSLPFDGVVAGLQALWRRDFKLACVTNKSERFSIPLLEQSGLLGFFDCVVSGDSLPQKKPHPLPLQHVCNKFEVPTYEAMLVGDSNTDVEAAHAAGSFIITVPYGYNQGQHIDEARVDAAITDLTELSNLIELLK
jgi:phosphoglycolate phosphatase